MGGPYRDPLPGVRTYQKGHGKDRGTFGARRASAVSQLRANNRAVDIGGGGCCDPGEDYA